ncbi:transcriptional regulator [Enterococcus thailandicus]|nr:GntR family transcriptional regulator YhfZ [Enterococcus thailandicus]MDK4353225.1 ABC transporter substrate-binding protein [Enterococcus thailandicus]MDT2733147.1 GntR family transcriptional regulator YhfZ [Enterococcus thailandicus]MEA4829596.1 GntR family transcriptional regulator YhfZ [Enterococcus thailandicus]GMC08167.1 transcriptional regulator [Enterococcus thailandicus]
MGEEFLKKKGIIVNFLASDLLQKKKGDRVPSVTDYQTKYEVARGTIQNALSFLKDREAIKVKSHGHLGTFIEEINYSILQEYALSDTILGTMTLPYSRLYEGLATGIYDVFKENNIKLNLAYIRGSKERVRSIVNKTYRFAVISKFAAEQAISTGEPIEISLDFGSRSYLSKHVLLFRDKNQNQIEKNMKIAIDYSSIDQQLLTKSIIKDEQVEYVEMQGHQIISALQNGQIDAGIWNYDEIRDKNHQGLHHVLLEDSQMERDMSTSVIITHVDDASMNAFFQKSVDKEKILSIQKDVCAGKIIPQY